MKRLFVIVLLLMAAGSSFSQAKKFVIGQGSTLNYTVHTPNGDVTVSTVLTTVNEEEVRFDWIMHSYTGRFKVMKASLDSARRGYWNPPVDGEDLTLDDSQTLLQLSKACWNDIRLNKPMVFGSTSYIVVQQSVAWELGDHIIDCIYLESVDKRSSLWVANNEQLPMIVKIADNPDGVSVEIVAVH